MEGSGRTVKLVSGTPTGGSTQTVAQFPSFTGTEKSLVYNPKNRLYYFIRDGRVYEYSPQTSRSAVVSNEPATTIAVSNNGDLIFATTNRQVGCHFIFTEKLIVLLSSKLNSMVINNDSLYRNQQLKFAKLIVSLNSNFLTLGHLPGSRNRRDDCNTGNGRCC